MFHIFYVNRGFMLVLEPPALGSVYDLQKSIADKTSVEVNDQFLFLSGGASLGSSSTLSALPGIGTDTNPLFLVQRVTNVQTEPIKVNADGINDLYQGWELGVDRLDRINATNANSSTTITECVDLGRKCANVAETIVRFCGNIISEHQYLHQGWMAIIANLDDNICRIQKRLDRSMVQAEKLDTIREKGRILLTEFDKVLDTLQKIIIPPTLLSRVSSSQSGPTNNLSDSDTSTEEMTLFDWISHKDPAYSLNSLAQHVRDHLEKTDDTDLRDAQALFQMVQEVARRSQYRDIGGIDKRLAMLNTNLQKLEESLIVVREATNGVIQPIIQDSAQNVAIWQKRKLNELKVPLKNQHDFALCFINSKNEVIRNISQRLATWIRQAYQRLHEVNKRVMCFEEKFTGLRQRLDLARQIKEAPSIYMTAVPEVVRREALKKEFTTWLSLHIEKSQSFIAEENRIRQEFFTKLDRHFLRQLFTGMGDTIPQFTAQTVPSVDGALPRVPVSHLQELRKTFPEMKDLLSVGATRVFSRFSIVDPNNPSAGVMTISHYPGASGGLRREESFYVRDRTSNMDAFNDKFPSTNWLNDEGMGISPSAASSNFLIGGRTSTTGFTASSASLQSIGGMELQSPQELGPLSEHFALTTVSSSSTIVGPASEASNRNSMSPLQPSAPIAIPMKAMEKDPIESIGSNHFSTPDDTFGSFGSNSGGPLERFAIGRHSFPNQSPFRCSPKITRPMMVLRAREQLQQQMVHREEEEEIECIRRQAPVEQCEESTQTQVPEVQQPEFRAKLAKAQEQLRELSRAFSALRQSSVDLHGMGTNSNLDVADLKRKIEECVESKCATVVEGLCIKMAEEKREKIAEMEEKQRERIEELAEEMQRERSLRLETERELLEQKAVVDRLNEEIAAFAKERKEMAKKHEEALTVSIFQAKVAEERAELVANQLAESAAQDLSIALSTSVLQDLSRQQQESTHSPPTSDDDVDGVARLTSSRSCGTQTKIRNKDMQAFVSLNEVYEGCGAVIIWNAQYNAYVARCTASPNFPYIVKDSCLEKLGIRKPAKTELGSCSSPATSPRPWMFAFVESIELCQIRKPENRYNLLLDTRFYRISVLPMPGEFQQATAMSSASSVTSSRR